MKKRHGNVAATRSFLRSFSESSAQRKYYARDFLPRRPTDRRSFTFSFAHDISHFNECASTRRRLSARRVHIHTATSTTLNRFNNRKAQQRTNFNSSNSATERSANNPTGDSLSSARRDKSAFVAPRAARFKNKHCQRKRKSLLFRRRTLIVFSPSSTWARTRPRRSRSPP